MRVIENTETNKHTYLRERAQTRAAESISLSDHDTGEQVMRIVRDRLDDGSQRVVITHAASEVPRELVEQAFDALRYSAIVCAPNGTGHIALIGMTEQQDALVAAVPWDTNDALDMLLSAARSQHVPVVLLPPSASRRSDSY
ncbi:MAG: DUF2064 domain-containing protein [Gemmatimonadota bacterium]